MKIVHKSFSFLQTHLLSAHMTSHLSRTQSSTEYLMFYMIHYKYAYLMFKIIYTQMSHNKFSIIPKHKNVLSLQRQGCLCKDIVCIFTLMLKDHYFIIIIVSIIIYKFAFTQRILPGSIYQGPTFLSLKPVDANSGSSPTLWFSCV